jgi:hypothetical protein
MVGRLNAEELKDICFDLNIDYDSLGAEAHSGKVRELIRYCQSRNQLDTLISKVREMRPDLGL